MSVVVYRCVFVVLLVATAVTRIQTSAAGALDVRAAVIDVAERAGASFREDLSQRQTKTLGASILFEVPGCKDLLQVIPVNLNLHESPIFATAVKENYVRRFVYLNRQWLSDDRMGMRLEWFKWKALSYVGLGRFVTVPTALLVAEPPGCNAIKSIDWPLVWDRNRRAASSSG